MVENSVHHLRKYYSDATANHSGGSGGVEHIGGKLNLRYCKTQEVQKTRQKFLVFKG